MQKIKALYFKLSLAVSVLAFASVASAQVSLTQTSLSTAITTTSIRYIQVASVTSITAPSALVPSSSQLYIDDEVLDVELLSGNIVTVRRGANGTKARTHLVGANVYVVPSGLGALIDYPLGGSCITGTYPANPMIDYLDAITYQCQNGQWQINTLQGGQHFPVTLLQTPAYTNATTSFTSVPALAFPVVGNHTYTATCQVVFQGSATTAGPKFQITGPASPTNVLFAVDGATGSAAYAAATATAFSSAVTAFGTLGAATTNYVAHLSVTVINGVNSGTVQLQAAAVGSGTLTIQPGSYCIQQ